MVSASRRYVIVFNGEIYNHLEIRRRLSSADSAPEWRGHSDTETLLAAIEAFGVEGALRAAHGMFALAVWDGREGTLTLARDRFGEKPLYWSAGPWGLAFASELKALMRSGLADRELSRDAAAALLRYNHIPAPHTVFKRVYKLEPGRILRFGSANARPEEQAYWSVFEAWAAAKSRPFEGSDADAVEEVERRLQNVIRRQMVADVPLGAFLSGGTDSSLIVSLMQSISTRPVRTFSIGFDEKAYNEADAAKSVATHLRTEHSEHYLTPADAQQIIPNLPDIYCEPFADSSQIPSYLVAKFARQSVTVALTGDGGDEVFGGYNRYLFGTRLFQSARSVPVPVRQALATLLAGPRPESWDKLGDLFRHVLPVAWRFQDPGDKVAKLVRSLAFRSPAELYESFLYQWWPDPSAAVLGATSSLTSSSWMEPALRELNFTEQMMAQDAIAYLPNDILVKLDRAAMAVGLEGRVPFLDHELYEFAATLPMGMKIRDGQTKWILKEILHRYVPKSLVDRAKTGFGIPIEHWLRGPLRAWAEALLSPHALVSVGIFDVHAVRSAWETHLSGRRNLQHPLWCVLMYQAWHERWMGSGEERLGA
jgi:asparagine synthase (glutamine-hydrolysing)